MASPQENTKIEQLTDAIESLCLACSDGVLLQQHTHPAQDKTPEMIAMNRADARAEVATALRDFLKPSLRVVTEIDKSVGAIHHVTRKTIEGSGGRFA